MSVRVAEWRRNNTNESVKLHLTFALLPPYYRYFVSDFRFLRLYSLNYAFTSRLCYNAFNFHVISPFPCYYAFDFSHYWAFIRLNMPLIFALFRLYLCYLAFGFLVITPLFALLRLPFALLWIHIALLVFLFALLRLQDLHYCAFEICVITLCCVLRLWLSRYDAFYSYFTYTPLIALLSLYLILLRLRVPRHYAFICVIAHFSRVYAFLRLSAFHFALWCLWCNIVFLRVTLIGFRIWA